ncbi:hypothetical protein [Paenibacillus sp. R14(2021)]|uniref:hypothetical protein n=1 Tax=Paenibacillus sp. R14(2021) TaxID=2859228 RepID=UPI001C613565|nr:hypothetical protein [Paenibacillus sp. R14(2021)]
MSPKRVTRRAFLSSAAKLTIGIGGILTGCTGLFYYGAVTHRKVGSEAPPKNIVLLGKAADLKLLQGVTVYDYEAEIVDAWYTKPVKGFVYVTVDEAGRLLIMSPTCSHLGYGKASR